VGRGTGRPFFSERSTKATAEGGLDAVRRRCGGRGRQPPYIRKNDEIAMREQGFYYRSKGVRGVLAFQKKE